MKLVLQLVQIIVAVLLVGSILMQAKGAGVGNIFGGEGQFYRSRRGVEKLLLMTTIVLAAIFAITSLVNVII